MGSASDFWQKLASRSQSNLYFALVFLPADRREAFRSVYRFLRAADDVSDAAGVLPADARARLAAWRRELDAVYAGTAAHPIARQLAAAVARFDLSRAHFDTILDALEADVEPRRFPDFAALERWCEAMSSTLGYLCLQILGPGLADSPGARAYARDMGVALQLANIVRDVGDDAASGRMYLPLDELAAVGCRAGDVLERRYTAEFGEAQARLAGAARTLMARARTHLSAAERRALLVPEIWADVYLALLDQLAEVRYDVFSRPPYLRRRKKVAIAALRWLHELRGSAHFLFPTSP